MAYREKDTISAREGRLYLDGVEVANCIKFEIKSVLKTVKAPILNKRIEGERVIGMETPEGKITSYRATSQFPKMIQQYKDTGQVAYFELMGVRDDISANRGVERITVSDCFIKEAVLMNFDAEGDLVKDEIPFACSDWNIQQELNPL